MASLIQPNVLPNRNNHNAYDTPSQTRGMTLANSSGLRGSAWSSITNIWQSTPQGQSTRPVGSLAPVSPTRSDSLTAPDSPQDLPERGAIGVAMGSRTHPLRSTNSSAVSAPSSNGGRSSYPTESPPRQRPSGFLSAQANSNMPHLGTAMLLNGSAPDIDLGLRTTYSSTRAPENRLQAINVGGIDEFVPASQQYHSRSRPSMLRIGNEWTPASHQLSLGLNASFMPNRQSNGGMLDSYGNGYNSTAAPLEEAWNQLSNANNTAGLASQPSFQGQSLTAALTSLHLSDIHQQRPNQSFSDSRGLGHPSHSVQHGDISGHGVLLNASSDPSDSRDPGYMTPQLSYQNANHDSSTLHGNKAFASSAGGGMYTPSYTPPTAPGSRRSNSGSGTSTRASSQSVDTGSAFFPNRPSGFPFSHTPAGNDFIPHAPASFTSAFMAPQNRMLRSYEGHSQRLSPSESRIQQEKEQNLSPLIKDFRANYKTKRYELKDAYNHIVEFSGDQHGSRFIQAKLETANSEEKEKVFAEIQENALQLMTDIFGNYVIQKMFEHGTQAQKKILANQMRGRVYYLTTQVYGCRVVQKALEHVLTDQQASMVKELEGNVLGIVENQNGNHVIQKAIERVPGEHIQFVFDAHIGHVVRLSKHNYGCRVVQRILEYGPPAVKRAVLGELREAIPILIEDQFGNYVMQHIIRNGELSDRRIVVTLILQQLLHFSKHKFASNVVEAAIECAEEEQRQEILRKLIWDTDSHGQSQVHGLIRDQYGNYVIQKVLTMLQGAALNDLIHEIQHHLVSLRKISHGKQVSAMEKALADAIVSLGSQYQGHESLLPRGGTEIQSRSSALGRGPARYVVAPGPRLHAHM